ncbi:DUF3429 domain-containing protein [Antarctobacter heliothermus]|uniref:DUF3429 domain-containing protein n=1 Tax=Antarctobacter heliothermus TaxID=74033 RepID=A0A239I8E1_9RHOB|nr:DUF3429 domain-containing protein [Antarctobacter heliothermus]SNS88594.1 Protein of unknown function [Antarctobacter heliothermus]
MTQIPRSALILGLAGVVPFVWGALTLLLPGLFDWGLATFGPRFVGPYVQLFYGAVILSFMSGVLWGFATKAEGRQAATGYALSTLPALWAFFTTGGGEARAAMNLIVGFLALLLLDYAFARWGLAPRWWMYLRLLLTGLVVACLAVIVLV